ncbi:alpha/beta-hydrolase [Didymella exigua CBS 183.55]|uniref:Carboxylic ester hydrolase n=1 Tax=Didymella exigua CBS 183.55 TaxID=1150837 RepID=A0A6A5RVF6_9PLEO|nr:alpha/beta-hydrolase [Didymella exigua CBS 183.55]KAF1931340.1 alpha/beta-hydrolase [Didymella exigua CBS 183.55]
MRFDSSALSLALPALISALSYNPTPTATIDAGVVVGKATALPNGLGPSVNQFFGIPFAQSPPERFSPPRNISAFSRPLNATAWKPACVQQFRYPLASQQFAQAVFNNPGGQPPVESEDCLYLNVYAPSGSPGGNGRAVMFWIYGGSLQFGTAGLSTYDGSAFADYEDVIVVTTNYRTNVFGFPASPELPVGAQNLGFLDQRFALDWVQRNIHAFGGDPAKVTIFGESAGGFSVDALLTSYPKNSKPPFRAAILQSGQYSYRTSSPSSSVPAWNNLTATLGCPSTYGSNLTCVRAADATEVKRIIEVNSLVFNPVADNVTLFTNPAARRLSGNISYVPVLTGSNSQEGRVFAVGQTNLTAFLRTTFSTASVLIPAIAAAYPIGSPGITNGYDAISAVITDLTFQCPAALWANATASIGIPTWRYYFNASFANTQAYPELGAYHASEIPLVFRTYPKSNTTTQEFALSSFMQGAWARFAKNPLGGPGWNPVGTGQAGTVLSGAYDSAVGGIYYGSSGNATGGDWNLAVLGDVGRVKGGGATIYPQRQLDYRCNLYKPIYQALVGSAGIPP